LPNHASRADPLGIVDEQSARYWADELAIGSNLVSPVILAIIVVVVVAGLVAVAVVVRSQHQPSVERDEPLRRIPQECASGGHNYKPFGTGYRCALCGNHVSSGEGELYGRTEDGHSERRREPR